MNRAHESFTNTESRLRLSELLHRASDHMRGKVLDLGGHRKQTRGTFRPPDGADWIYLNIEAERTPDVLGFGERLPFADAVFDTVVCCQVLEHVFDERLVVSEVARVLKPGGTFILSVPFLYMIHA